MAFYDTLLLPRQIFWPSYGPVNLGGQVIVNDHKNAE